MRIERVTFGGPAASLIEAKEHLRVDYDDEDAQIEIMLEAATRELEEHAALAVRTSMIRVQLDGWPADGVLRLPIGPTVADAELTVTADGAEVEALDVFTGNRPALRPVQLISPELRSAEIQVIYAAGWGESLDDVPGDIRLAVLDQCAAYFDARGSSTRREVLFSPHMARIAGRYRRVRA